MEAASSSDTREVTVHLHINAAPAACDAANAYHVLPFATRKKRVHCQNF